MKYLKSTGEHHFYQFNDFFTSKRHRKLLLQKGVYPYAFVTDPSKFSVIEIPPQHEFYNTISNRYVSDEKYEHAKEVWREMKIKTMGEYHDLYVLCDVLLLSDVFERFRSVSMESFDLDPAQYYTLAGVC